MPRTVAETPLTETPSPALDDLLERGRAQGRLSLDEVRRAFEAAGISPGQGRSILRELSEAGISLASEDETAAKRTAKAARTAKTPTTAGNAGKSTRTTRTAKASDTMNPTDPTEITDPASDAEGDEAPAKPAPRATRKTAAKPAAAKKAPAKKRATAAKTAVKAAPEPEADAPGDNEDEDDAADGAFELTEVEAAEPSAADLDDQSTTMGDSVHTYLKAIGRRQLLTAEQEVDLAKRIEAGLYAEHLLEDEDLPDKYRIELEWVAGDGRRAKSHMLEANLRLVVSVAKKYSDRGLSLLDVVQEGNLGLIRAVEKFDYSKGYKFSTYAMWWIRQAIQRGFADSARTIRLPVHVLEMLSKLSRVERDMHQRLGREPTPEELALELDKSPEQVRELLRTSRQPISLDSTIGEDGETRIGDLIEDTDSPEASELVDRQLMADQLRRTLDILNPREAKIMAMRFGLYDGTPRTLDEIGKALGLTRERIRQLEKESLSKLRHPSNAQPLLDFAV
ncbi:RNA polymerase sigma factor [Actinomadura oligospora]|uniref:RNA polymerase sigma factor n=1 Tax=Actinomadura oligospora TaxID=111804 RepID=UPI00047CBB0C|nr:RNA polymerase sigma factor [Actinomadura oligospora]